MQYHRPDEPSDSPASRARQAASPSQGGFSSPDLASPARFSPSASPPASTAQSRSLSPHLDPHTAAILTDSAAAAAAHLLPQRSGALPRAMGPGAIGLTTSQRYALPTTTFSPEASPPIYTYSTPAASNPSVAQTGLQRRTASTHPTDSSQQSFDPDNHAGRSAASNATGRRIIRVNKRHASTWAGEIKAGLVAVYGYPGRKNPMFYIKVLLTIGLLVLLFAFLFLRPTQHTVVQAPVHEFLNPLEDSHGADHAHPELPPLTNKDLTIFTVFSPENTLSPEHSVHLRAVHSWLTRLADPSQVHVYVKDYSHCLGLHVLGVTCRVSSCWDEEFDAPRLVCLLTEANTRATTELMLYIDDHIILFEDILPALFRVGRLERFLALGRSKPLTLKLDSNLDLNTWQHDLESAVFLDSSDEQQNDLLGQVGFEQRPQARESKSLHYIAYARTDLDLSAIPPHLLMDGGSYTEHGWESAFLATMLVNDDVHVVDVSTAVTAIEFSHIDTSNHTSLLNEHNRILSTNFTGLSDLHYTAKQADMIAHLALGRLENAHYVLTGRCPTCSLKENRESDLPLILLRKANSARQVIVIATNADYLALTFNWICRAEMLGITNFVMLAEDRVAYRILRKMNVAVVLRKDAPYRKSAAAVNSKDFQETLYLRALFFNQVVSLGFSLIMTHLDTIWFFNPLPLLTQSDCDMFVQMEKGSRSSGGLLTIRSSPIGQQFAQDYLLCEQENWNFIVKHGKTRFSFADDVDIDCIELISTRLMRRSNLKRCVLDPVKYVTERDFFDKQVPQRLGVWPYFVHMNQALGVLNKTASFTSWHLWGVDDDAMSFVPRIADAHSHGQLHCIKPPPTLPKPAEDASQGMKMIIHLLASTEHKSLELTLLSLSAARYDPTIPIDLTITLQRPQDDTAANSAAYQRTKQLIQDFAWAPRGQKMLVILDSYVGPTDLWIDQWNIPADNTAFIVVLLAGQVLSPQWFTWSHTALEHYYFDPFSYDAQLMAISLVHQLTIPGETPNERFGSKLPSQILVQTAEEEKVTKLALNKTESLVPTTQHLYLYQYVPLAGTIFFPRHFATFVQWYLQQNVSDARVPCVPTLISNKWWQEDSSKHWEVWLTRFTFEAGWYALYTNFHSPITDPMARQTKGGTPMGQLDAPRALVVDDQPTAGSLVISLLKRLQPAEQVFPPRSALSLFDLHFHPFTEPPAQLQRRKFHFPPLPSSTSMTRAADLESHHFSRGDSSTEANEGSQHMLKADAGGQKGVRMLTGSLSEDQRSVHSASVAHTHDASLGIEEDAEVSHLDVMIESMIQEMEERAGNAGGGEAASANLEGKPDLSELQAAATLRSQRRRSPHLQPHHAHHTKPIRGGGLDRCYIVEHAKSDEETEECKHCFMIHDSLKYALQTKIAEEAHAAREAARALARDNPTAAAVATIKKKDGLQSEKDAKVDPMQKYLTSTMDAEELYNLMYDVAKSKFPLKGQPYDEKSGVRFMLYQPLKPAAFDRHLRGIYFSFILALLTNRILLIDLPDMDMMYECPFPGATWTWKEYHAAAGAPVQSLESSKYDLSTSLKNVKSDVFDSKRAAELRTASLDHMYQNPLLIHSDMVTHDRVIFKNAMYKSYSAALFGSSSRMRRTGFIMKLLLSKPRPKLLAAVETVKNQVGLTPAKFRLSVHVVVPADKVNKPLTAADPLPGVTGKHWDCVSSFLVSMGMVADEAVIFFSTNRPSVHAFALARKEMGRFGRVVTHPLAHLTNLTTGGVSSSGTSSSIALDQSGEEMIDPALVSGFILGETDVSISSGTTYGIFHSARTNFVHKALIVKLPPPAKKGATQEEEYCGPMHRLDLPLQEDITY